MLKIVHIADLHLDSPFALCTMKERGEKRQELKDALSSVCDYCLENEIDVLLVAGDLFDGDFVRRETVEFTSACFAKIPKTRVFIAPGNHDAYGSASPYKYCSFSDNVHIFSEEKLESVVVPELSCAVYGYGFNADRMTENPLSGIHPFDTERVNILVAHGDLDSVGSPYYNIKSSDLAASDIDYVALGHIHKPSGFMRFGNTVCAYSGCLVGRDFGECGTRGMIAGEIIKGNVSLKYIPVAEGSYEEITVDVTGKDVAEIAGEVKNNYGDLSEKIQLRLILSGEREDEIDIRMLTEFLPSFRTLEIKDLTRQSLVLEELLKEYSLRGAFARMIKPYLESDSTDISEKASIALKYGLDALKK